MPILFIENADSFSWNVVDLLRFDHADIRICSGADAARSALSRETPDAVVIGPGPTDPIRAGLVDIVRIVADRQLPLLGICLGHQAIGLAFGARLVQTNPVHGKTCSVHFDTSRLLPEITGPRVVMRYHSLSLCDVVSPLRIIARTPDNIPMAVEHESLPIVGMQFHPDSYATPDGRQMTAAFFESVL